MWGRGLGRELSGFCSASRQGALCECRQIVPGRHTSTVGARLPVKIVSAPGSSLTHRHLITPPECLRGGGLLVRDLCGARQGLADVLIWSCGVTSPSSARKSPGSHGISDKPHSPRNSRLRSHRFWRHVSPWFCGSAGTEALGAGQQAQARLRV